jgi:DNA repair exonuclease SbcCD nuclease subunit
MPRRFIHAADLHLDSPFAGIGTLREGFAEVLRDASLEAWDALVQLCIDEHAELLVLAGDLFDSECRTSRFEFRVQQGARRLVEHGIRVVIVHGNHDPLSARSPLSGIEGVEVLRKDEPITKRIARDGVGDIHVHGVSFGRARVEENLAELFPVRGPEPGLHIGVLHCAVGDRPGHGRYAPCSIEDLRRTGYDYWALGHIHGFDVLEQEPWIVYAGSLQGRSLKPSDRGVHGAVVVEFDDDRVLGARLHPIDVIRFEELVVPIEGIESTAALADRVLAEADALLAATGDAAVVVRGRLVGRGPLSAEVGADQWADGFRGMLDDAAPERLVWESIVADVRPEIELDQLRQSGGFAGDVVRAFDRVSDDPAELERRLAELDGQFAERRAVRERSPEDRLALLDRARDLALEELLRQEEAQ